MLYFHSFRCWICATLLLAASLFSSAEGNSQDFPPQYPECRGRNLLADLKAKDPQAYDRWTTAARKISNSDAILWRIDGHGLAEPSWLFGTMHVTDARILNIPVAAQEAFIKSRSLAVETPQLGNRWADSFNSLFALPLFYLPDDKTWEQYLTQSELKFMETELRAYGYTLDRVKRMQPWVVIFSILLYPSCEQWRNYLGLAYLDAELASWARKANKPVIGLETRYESSKVIAETSLKSQFRAMLACARAMQAPEDEQETFIQIYLARQLGLLVEYEHGPYDFSPHELQALQDLMHHVADLRNLRMRDRALRLINEGGAFIAVGAAHLPGDQGLVELFRKAGYEVTPVN